MKEAHQYNGFNLIVADLHSRTMMYISNRPKGEAVTVQEVSPGIHVLSNAKLDSPWHKVCVCIHSLSLLRIQSNALSPIFMQAKRLGKNFKELFRKCSEEYLPVKEMQRLMRDAVKADRGSLPRICSLDWEYNLSSIYVEVDTPLVSRIG